MLLFLLFRWFSHKPREVNGWQKPSLNTALGFTNILTQFYLSFTLMLEWAEINYINFANMICIWEKFNKQNTAKVWKQDRNMGRGQ